MTSQFPYPPITQATASGLALDPVIDCIINSGITLVPSTELDDADADDDAPADDEPELDEDGEPVFTEDDIQAQYADWCNAGRGFGA